MRGLAGKNALITGAGRGIGRDVALRLAAEGVAVAVNYHTSEIEAATVVDEAREGDLVVVMSNGAFGEIHNRLLAALGSDQDEMRHQVLD
mgnify:CR=1 FL=1